VTAAAPSAVDPPPDQFLAALFDRAGGLLQSVQGLLLALTTVVVAGLGLWAALRRRGGAKAGAGGDQQSRGAPPA
jgi:hypothetical protein